MLLLVVLSVFNVQPWQSSNSSITTDFVVLDFDNDGDIDVAFCDYEWPDGANVYLYENVNGILTGPVWTSSWTGGSFCITAGDFDNDGYVDLAVGTINLLPQDGGSVIFRNQCGDHSGWGSPVNVFSLNPVWTSNNHGDVVDIQMADIDNDGWLELVVVNKDSRVMMYDGSSSGLNPNPIDPFNSDYGSYAQSSFCISSFSTDLGFSPSTDLHLLCPWGNNNDTRLYGDLGSMFSGFFDPTNPEWQSAGRESGDDYVIRDLDADGYLDWVAFDGSNVIEGINSGPLPQTEFDVNEIILPAEGELGWIELVHVLAIDIACLDSSNPNALYFALANRGYKEPNGTFVNAEDKVYLYVRGNEQASLTLVWQRPVSVPTLSIGMYDIDEQSSDVTVNSVSYTVSVANQVFVLPERMNRIVSVTCGGVFLNRDNYHADIQNSIVSLIGDYTGQSIMIGYIVSYGNDLICATVGRNVVYYHE